jgi:flagellar biosynthesis protein FlhG
MVSQAVLRQKPFLYLDPKCKAAISIHHLVSRIEKTDFHEEPGLQRFIKKLFGRD